MSGGFTTSVPVRFSTTDTITITTVQKSGCQ
jgi:hypothetical protein